ncbi:MAG TPA: DsrE family protein [Pseudomonadota bacterium]|jgi:sulfur relay (sulfurtransferase) DsrF/TusC family protein|nr:DsrE family protein [Pseudomonadota bacterium]
MKRVAVLFSRGPGRGVDAQAGIDAALAVLAFEHDLQVGFVGAGVELLAGADQGDERAQRHRMIAALAHHGASRMLASGECLAARGLAPQLQNIEQVERGDLANWLAEADHVLAF